MLTFLGAAQKDGKKLENQDVLSNSISLGFIGLEDMSRTLTCKKGTLDFDSTASVNSVTPMVMEVRTKKITIGNVV